MKFHYRPHRSNPVHQSALVSAISSPPTKSSVDSTRRPRNSVNCDERGIEAQKLAEPSILPTFMAHIPNKLNTPNLRHYYNVIILRTSNWL